MKTRRGVIGLGLLLSLFLGFLGCDRVPTAPPNLNSGAVELTQTAPSSSAGAAVAWSGNFNGTAIPGGRVIWFTGVLGYSGPTAFPVTFHLTKGSIRFNANGVAYNVPVPDGTVILSPTALQATTHYDPVSQSWLTISPFGASGVVLFSALPWVAPVDLPGGIKPVTWTAQFSTDTPGTSIKWKWSAAVYTAMSGNPQDLGVKAVDGDQFTIYRNSDHAGTPENYKSMVAGGAMGGGGSNYTGGQTGDLVILPGLCDSGALNGSAKISGDQGGSLTVGRYTVVVPPHAYGGDATISINVPDRAVLQCNLSINPVSSNHFAVPVNLVTSYDGGNVADPSSLVQVWFDESAGVWRQVPGSQVDTTNETVTTPLPHFSIYGIARGGKAGW